MKSPHPILRNAYLVERVAGDILVGNVFQDPRFPEGKQINTSHILWRSEDFVETENTTYRIESWADDYKNG